MIMKYPMDIQNNLIPQPKAGSFCKPFGISKVVNLMFMGVVRHGNADAIWEYANFFD